MKLLPSRRVIYTIQPCTMSLNANPHSKVQACLAVTCHLHVWQNHRDLLRATAVTRVCGTNTEIRVKQKVDPGEEYCPAASAGTRTRDLSVTSPAL